jgi:hypothetical protein
VLENAHGVQDGAHMLDDADVVVQPATRPAAAVPMQSPHSKVQFAVPHTSTLKAAAHPAQAVRKPRVERSGGPCQDTFA